MPVILTDEELTALQDPPPETATTPAPQQAAPVEQAPVEQAATAPVGPPPDEAPPVEQAPAEPAVVYDDSANAINNEPYAREDPLAMSPEREADLAARQAQYGEVPATSEAEAGYETAPAPPADTGEVIATELTPQQADVADLSGEPIQTPAQIPGEMATAPGPVSDVVQVPPEPVGGPVAQKEQDIGEALGAYLAPAIAGAPEPVRNVANSLGQPVGGLAEGAATAADQIAANQIGPAIADFAGNVVGGPQARGVQQLEGRLAEGQRPTPGMEEVLADPGQATAFQAGVAGQIGPVPAITGLTFSDYVKSLSPEEVADAINAGPGVLHQQWIDTATGGGAVPPPDLVNPADRIGSPIPLIAGKDILGSIPDVLGGIGRSSDEGTLAPFLLNMAQQTVEDPTLLIPGRVGELAQEKALGAVKKLPGVRQLVAPAATEAARLAREVQVADIGTYNVAKAAQEANPLIGPGEEIAADIPPTPVGAVGQAVPPIDAAAPPAGAVPVTNAVIYPVEAPPNGMRPSFDVYQDGQRVASSSDLPNIQRQYPGARVAPSRAEMIQQYEREAGRMGVPGSEDPVTDQRLKDRIYAQNPYAFPEEAAGMRARNNVRTAYQNAPEVQNMAERTMGEDPGFVHTIAVPDAVAERMNQTALPMNFPDGFRPVDRTGAEIADLTMRDVGRWLEGHAPDGTLLEASNKDKQWLRLNRRFNPGDALPPEEIAKMTFDASNPSVLTSRARARAEFTTKVLHDALEAAAPAKQATAIGAAFGHYTNALRQVMLFNYLNSLHYITSNLSSNTLNIIARGGGPRVALGVFTDLPEWVRVFKNQRDPTSATTLDATFRKMGTAPRVNIQGTSPKRWMDRVAADDRAGRTLPSRIARKVTDVVTRALAPETLRFIDSVPDVLGRNKVGLNALHEGYHQLNGELVPMLNKELNAKLGRVGLEIPTDLVQKAVDDFKQTHRTLVDPNSGELYTTMMGRVRTMESVYSADEFRVGVKENLVKELKAANIPTDPGQLNRAINDATHDVRNRIEGIADQADATVDDALFSWRNSVADEWIAKGFLYHYWTSRQAGFYVSEAMKHPWMAASYGRMMQEMNDQADEFGAPEWLRGWFGFMRSTAGYSTFYQPIDMLGSLLTNAQFQFGDDPGQYDDLTELGRRWKTLPVFLNPLFTTVPYLTGALGPDYRPPDPTGVSKLATQFADILNLANASGAPFMQWVNDRGIGVDAEGNKTFIPTKPIEQLMAESGNFISSALAPLTGFSPIDAKNMMGTQERDMNALAETQVLLAHPEWQDGSLDSLQSVNRAVDRIMADPGSAEYESLLQQVASQKFQLGAGVPQPFAGILRNASPIGITTMPEQVAQRSFKNLPPSGQVPLGAAPEEGAQKAADAARYGMSKTPEGRRLSEDLVDYHALISPAEQTAYTTYWQIANHNLPAGTITINGQPYSNEDLANGDSYQVADAYLAEQNLPTGFIQSVRDARGEYLRDHPTTAAYLTYQNQIDNTETPEGGNPKQVFTDQMRQTNPSFAQYYESNMVDHITGAVDYDKVSYPDAFLAASGIRPSVYSPTVGNEPSTTPGGYPSIPGVEPGQPILPSYETNTVDKVFVYPKPSNVAYPLDYDTGKDTALAILDPSVPIQAMGPPQRAQSGPEQKGYDIMVVQVAQNGKPIGWVDASLLANTSAVKPVGQGTLIPPGGGLTQQAGKFTGAVGGIKDASLEAVGGALGGVGQAIGGAIPPPPTMAPSTAAPVPEILSAAGGAAPAPAATMGGPGNPLDMLGGAVQGVASGISSILGHNSGTPVKPTTATNAPVPAPGSAAPGFTPGKLVLEPGLDGLGIQADPVPSDETWVENMMGGHAAVTTPYKGIAPAGVDYSYQNGHGAQMVPCPSDPNAMCFVHGAMDISCDTPAKGCAGTPVSSPIKGTVLCAGYGVGDTGLADRTCDFALHTTNPNDDKSPAAHDVVLDVGADSEGNRLYLTFSHMGKTNLQVGQEINVGDAIGTMGNTDGGPHTHLEAWGQSPELGQTKVIDPHLLVGGYYTTHGVDSTDLGTTPAPTTAPTTTPSTVPSQVTPRTSPGLTPGDPAPYQPLVQQAATDNDVPPEILGALLQQESQYDPAALSPAGAQGIAQFMPETAKGYGIDPYDPNQAIPTAAQMLRELYDATGSWEGALASYNAGLGNYQKYNGVPPFPETIAYVDTILRNAGYR